MRLSATVELTDPLLPNEIGCPNQHLLRRFESADEDSLRSFAPAANGIRPGSKRWHSGLWHQAQCNGQPFSKTVVRMPGPS
jgi:hypothetical protein